MFGIGTWQTGRGCGGCWNVYVSQEMFWWECLGYKGQNFLVGPLII